jgi:hypothetical protein
MAEQASLRGFARLIGVNDKAVRKGISSGRLRESVGKDAQGKPLIVDVDLAKAEWTRNAGRPARGRGLGADDRRADPSAGPHSAATTLTEAQRLAALELARHRRLANDAKEGSQVSAAIVKREAFEAMRLVREAMLNISSRVSGELAAETDEAAVFRTLDAAIREALASTADVLEATVH